MSTITCESLILEISARMTNPDAVKSFMSDPANQNPNPLVPMPNWSDLSFASGYPSLLLLFGTLQNANMAVDPQAAHRYVLKIKESLEKDGFHDLSFYGGLTGICFALQQASAQGTRYQRMIHTLNTLLIEKIEKHYLLQFKEKRIRGESISSSLHDAISGLSGVGRYVLENLSEPRFHKLAQDITSACVTFSQPMQIDGHQVHGWYLNASDSINERSKSICLKGNFNLGLAHGVTGVLAYLSLASLHGIDVEGQKDAIKRIALWIKAKSFIKNNTINWPYNISWEEEIEKKIEPKIHSRDAWCYGVPGIARALFLAGSSLKDNELKNFALEAFRGIFNRTQTEWHTPGPGLCHGLAGLLSITSAMARESECQELAKRKEVLTQLLLNTHNLEFPYGFQDIEPTQNGLNVAVSKVGFLEGVTGVLLTLLTLKESNSKWSIPLLIT